MYPSVLLGTVEHAAVTGVSLELDLDVHAGGELEAHEPVHRLRGRNRTRVRPTALRRVGRFCAGRPMAIFRRYVARCSSVPR